MNPYTYPVELISLAAYVSDSLNIRYFAHKKWAMYLSHPLGNRKSRGAIIAWSGPHLCTLGHRQKVWIPQVRGLSVWSRHVLPESSWIFSGFLSQSKDMKVNWRLLIDHMYKSEHEWLFVPMCRPSDELRTWSGCRLPCDPQRKSSIDNWWMSFTTVNVFISIPISFHLGALRIYH